MSASTDTATRQLWDALALPPQPIERGQASVFYRAGLLAVAVAMVLLPVLYVTIAFVSAAVVYVVDDFLLKSESFSTILMYLVAAVTAAGAAVVVCLFKPFFARRPPHPDAIVVTRTHEPLLFALVDHVCAMVGAPQPAAIEVTCLVNASAGFSRGLWSVPSGDLTLSIGLPLVESLTVRELAGILGHELGHFSQGTGMRLTYAIRSINTWFARVVYERDAWDAFLEASSRSGRVGFMVVANAGRAGAFVARRVLWGLMMCGHAISCFASRQMEFDADACQARISGSACFERTMLRVHELSVAMQSAFEIMLGDEQRQRLVDDLPAFVAARARSFDERTREAIRSHALVEKTGVLDTHPSPADRIAAAQALGASGSFACDEPAEVLLTDANAVRREATERYYEVFAGSGVHAAPRVAVAQLLAASEPHQP